mmetsp:Transcript_30202/g.102640  ORF Transcript_30202/g.102640 Transcript_30202/m.102640 type:complete len:308 (-) Transcript_30202:968-1891(-)
MRQESWLVVLLQVRARLFFGMFLVSAPRLRLRAAGVESHSLLHVKGELSVDHVDLGKSFRMSGSGAVLVQERERRAELLGSGKLGPQRRHQGPEATVRSTVWKINGAKLVGLVTERSDVRLRRGAFASVPRLEASFEPRLDGIYPRGTILCDCVWRFMRCLNVRHNDGKESCQRVEEVVVAFIKAARICVHTKFDPFGLLRSKSLEGADGTFFFDAVVNRLLQELSNLERGGFVAKTRRENVVAGGHNQVVEKPRSRTNIDEDHIETLSFLSSRIQLPTIMLSETLQEDSKCTNAAPIVFESRRIWL